MHTIERQLTAVHENIIIGSPGFWRLTSPDAAVLRTHFYLRVRPLDLHLCWERGTLKRPCD